MSSGDLDISKPGISVDKTTDEGIYSKVAIVDDESSLVMLFSLALRKGNYSIVKTCSNGKEFLEYLESIEGLEDPELPNVVLMDYRMPVLDGLETAKLLRINFPEMKIIMVSGFELPNESIGYFDAHLRKPVAIEELLQKVYSVTA